MTSDEARPYNPMAKFIRQGRDFNPPVSDMMLERKHFARRNDRFTIEMTIIPKNKYSSAKGTIQIYKVNDDGTPLHLYTTQTYDFRFIQTHTENTFKFIFHTLPHGGESYTYIVQYHVVFDNNAESLYSYRDNITSGSASLLLMDQIKIITSSKSPISIGHIDVITENNINIINSNLKFTIDGMTSNENLIQDVSYLTAADQLDWMFYPVYIKRITIGGFPQTQLQNWNKDMFSSMVLQVIYKDKLVFVAPLEELDETNQKIEYNFTEIVDVRDMIMEDLSTREYGLNTGIDFLFLNSGWRIASPERLWFFIVLVCSLLLYITYIYFALDILFIIIPIPLILFYTTKLSSYGLEDVDPDVYAKTVDPGIYAEMKQQWVMILVVGFGIGIVYTAYRIMKSDASYLGGVPT